jgi:hypothetical protein
MTRRTQDNNRFLIGRGMSAAARAADTDDMDTGHILNRQRRAAAKAAKPATPPMDNFISGDANGFDQFGG